MLRVNRKSIAAPAVLTARGCVGKRERQLACAYHKAKASGTAAKPVEFKAYGLPEVREALRTLFHGKCAYCESRFDATQPVDVEHYRPKSAVAEDRTHPGYYWLAADWANLLPSCIDCNRVRNQDDATRQGQPGKSGKGTYFPLQVEAKRVRQAGSVAREQPLLLNPCKDTPARFLDFLDKAVVRAKKTKKALAARRAEASIKIYGLNRTGLVTARLETLRLLEGWIIAVKDLAEILDQIPRNQPRLAAKTKDRLAKNFSAMMHFAKADQPYSLMCRQRIARFKREVLGGALKLP